MRYSTFFLLLFTGFLISACSSEPKKKPPKFYKLDWQASKKNKRFKELSDQVYHLIIDSCRVDGRLALHHVEITPKMRELIMYRGYDLTCEFLESNAGQVEQADFMELIQSRSGLLFTTRYKLQVEKQDKPLEFRSVFTIDGKLTEFQMYEWKDAYKEDLIDMNWF